MPCHGLATAIERDAGGPRVGELIGQYTAAVAALGLAGSPILVGLCCTHFGYVGDRLRAAIGTALGREAVVLDPNIRMAEALERGMPAAAAGESGVTIEVISKIVLDDRTRAGVASLVDPVSPATARALEHYTHEPGLF
jgi:hypothetical protein